MYTRNLISKHGIMGFPTLTGQNLEIKVERLRVDDELLIIDIATVILIKIPGFLINNNEHVDLEITAIRSKHHPTEPRISVKVDKDKPIHLFGYYFIRSPRYGTRYTRARTEAKSALDTSPQHTSRRLVVTQFLQFRDSWLICSATKLSHSSI